MPAPTRPFLVSSNDQPLRCDAPRDDIITTRGAAFDDDAFAAFREARRLIETPPTKEILRKVRQLQERHDLERELACVGASHASKHLAAKLAGANVPPYAPPTEEQLVVLRAEAVARVKERHKIAQFPKPPR